LLFDLSPVHAPAARSAALLPGFCALRFVPTQLSYRRVLVQVVAACLPCVSSVRAASVDSSRFRFLRPRTVQRKLGTGPIWFSCWSVELVVANLIPVAGSVVPREDLNPGSFSC
jgi:hypothetical protein